MDGSIPATAAVLHGESREPADAGADAGGFVVAPREKKVSRACPVPRSRCRASHRVHLLAPADWKFIVSSARNRDIDWTAEIPAPAWRRRPPVAATTPTKASPARAWLLPPTWPLDVWRAPTRTDMCRIVGTRIVCWAQTWMNSCQAWAGTFRYRLAAGIAIGSIAGITLMSLRIHASHASAQPASASPVGVMHARLASATFAPPLSRKPAAVAVVTMPAPASAPTISPSAVSWSPETDRALLSNASTMDLMMPIEEPDLDITSRKSLWSQVGKTYGVDPLLLYSIALVESKALYPDGKVAPTPWLFRVNNHLVRGDRHDVQLAMAAASQFGSAVQDVGIMQVYYPMHRDAVRDPLTLLNPRTNIAVAAKILHDGMHQTRDPVLGVGYYHSHTPSLARDYGTAVLTVYLRLRAIHRWTARATTVAR